MTTARDIIRLVLESIDSDIKHQESLLRFAEAKLMINKDEKMMAMTAGMDFVRASIKYDQTIGFYSGMEAECKDRIEVLKRKRAFYDSIDKRIANKAEEEEENE